MRVTLDGIAFTSHEVYEAYLDFKAAGYWFERMVDEIAEGK